MTSCLVELRGDGASYLTTSLGQAVHQVQMLREDSNAAVPRATPDPRELREPPMSTEQSDEATSAGCHAIARTCWSGVLALAFLLICGFAIYRNVDSSPNRPLGSPTLVELGTMEGLSSDLGAAESSARAYYLTGDDAAR